ncbi:Predicted nucleotidyltransferase [Paenibacillus uliginis N3/975]|uniref:tRNA(Met) cytidine acetate ligase n=1 Tax=Paenibacillus uliginis N3/975 TaxID=1313296 RepID=A0A1X7H7V6_9BACL|nr:nucleotidyltransferase [Paenibacillus uliginis]SMF81234.1 Predicted nucleotidyltransferase [Paenibacillus uliginis N3/975]
MKTVGIIVEYNPLHNGHVLHYTRSKEITGAEAVVAVMSGPFLQRGEPALVNKRARTEMALRMGVDLVIELPTTYAVQPAEWFAYGACALLNATGVVDCLSFGSESGTLQDILPLAERLAEESGELRQEIAKRMSSGSNFPSAYAAAAAAVTGASETSIHTLTQLLSQPNNSLGLHYLIALKRLGSQIVPYTIPRDSAQYHDLVPAAPSIASATSVRKLILESGLDSVASYVPDYTLDILHREFAEGLGPMDWERFRQPMFHALFTQDVAKLELYHEVTEGLEHRIHRLLPQLAEPTVESLLDALKTKRYTRTKLQRMLLHILLHHNKSEMTRKQLEEGPGYIRILGFSATGRALLKKMKETASLPVIVRPSTFNHPHLARDLEAAAIYANACPKPSVSAMFSDYFLPPVTL